MGLATYLVCLLLKQHMGVREGSLDGSILCLQASSERTNQSRSFYLKLGFISHDHDDNGFSLTSAEFQAMAFAFPKVWVSPDKAKMSLLKLTNGRLILSDTVADVVDLTTSDTHAPITWQTYCYSKFPFVSSSMKKIESFVDICPILKWLSRERLPMTDRPYIPTRSLSIVSGKIYGSARASLQPEAWLKTDDIQFLVAFLMHNRDDTGFVHVLDPTITKKVSQVYSVFAAITDESANEDQYRTYDHNLNGIRKYIDSRMDILENKFLVFLISSSNVHWISVVVINPFLVYDQDLDSDEMAGWCVLNSANSEQDKQHHESGLQGTCFTKNKADYGVRLFLNICASYIKSKNAVEGGELQGDSFDYQEPYGHYNDTKGTV
jgi:hypothetical protein